MRSLLLPVSAVYALVSRMRNELFDLGLLEEKAYPLPVICVGNIRVGGTGKSPLVEYLIGLLKQEFRPAVLSRGYGRKTKGFLEVEFPADSQTAGDEPAQIKNKFAEVPVYVSEDRRKGIEHILSRRVENQVILLDDAFQHRRVLAGLNLVLMQAADVFRPKISLPAGDYREGLDSLKRAQALVITKNTETPGTVEVNRIRKQLGLQGGQALFFSSIEYLSPEPIYPSTTSVAVNLDTPEPLQVFLLSGIANATPLVQWLESKGHQVIHHAYPDHHPFTQQNLQRLALDYTKASGSKIIITTEKDAQRLKNRASESELINFPLYYIPIRNQIWSAGAESFDSFILRYVRAALSDGRIHQEKNRF